MSAQLHVAAFREELAKLGWIGARNVHFDYRWASGGPAPIRLAAKELVALKPDVVLVRTTPATLALQHETKSIPIVFVVVADPLGDRLVDSLGRPGGNITGVAHRASVPQQQKNGRLL